MEEGEVDREVDVGTMVPTEVVVAASPANPWDMSGHVGSVVPMIIFLFIAHMMAMVTMVAPLIILVVPLIIIPLNLNHNNLTLLVSILMDKSITITQCSQ